MGAADPSAGAAAADAGGKGGGGAGAGDPFSSFGGSSGFDPTSMFGDGFGGGISTPSAPGGNISDVANAQGDPTGSVQAQQSLQAGVPTPGTPGGGIGGAQSNAGTPSGPAQLAQAQQPATMGGYKPGATTGQPMDQQPAAGPDSSIPKTTGPGSGEQYGPPMQPPQNFSQRFGDATFNERFGTGPSMLQPGQQATQLAQAGMNMPPAQAAMGGGTPNVDATTAAGPAGAPGTAPAAAPAAAPAPTATPGTSTPDTGAGAATGAGKTPSTTDTTDPSSTGGRDSFSDRYTGGQGQGGMPQIDPMRIIGALLRGGPMGALAELARAASGQGMMNPSLPGGGAPGRSGGPYGGQPSGPEAPATPETPAAPGQPGTDQARPPEANQAAQAAQAGVAPSSTGVPSAAPGQAGGPTTTQAPPAWAQQVAGQPNVGGAQNAALGNAGGAPGTSAAPGGPGTGTNAQTDRWVSPQHVSMNRNAGTNTPGTPGYSTTMRDARAPYFDQLRPQDRTLLYGMMNAENERDPIGPMESLANRSVASRMSMRRLIDSGFYGPRSSFLRRGLAIQNSGRAAHYDSVINAVRHGSNVLGGATDQGSGRDPNVGHRGGRILRSGETYNDWGGGRGHAANAAWREQIQARVRAENAANPPRPPAPIPNAQRVGEGSPIASFGPGSMGQGNIAQDWRRSSNVENVNQPTFDQRFEGDMSPAEARIRKGNYEASLPGYAPPPSQLANALGLGDIRLDQITQLLGQLQQNPPQ